MQFTEEEIRVMAAVLEELSHMKYDDLNGRILHLGTETIDKMQRLESKLYYRDYCERHGIRYEDMAELDYEAAYEEKWCW